MDKEFGLNGDDAEFSDETVVAIVTAGDKTIGLVMDSVMEPQEVVVKSLGKYIGSVSGIAGATILGNGQVSLILDTPSMVRTTAIN